MNKSQQDRVRQAVRQTYAEIARRGEAGCACAPSSCYTGNQPASSREVSQRLGYSPAELRSVPESANLGLGCGNPQPIAALKPGETVVDLGSGAGLDCFLAAKQVGDAGLAIGVDMTPEMIAKARDNASRAGCSNVDFRLGEIEHLPIADGVADVILSNCVINLSPDKPSVYREAYRVLRPGGRLAISDVVALAPLSEEVRGNLSLLSGCVSGAATIGELEDTLRAIGFHDIRIQAIEASRELIHEWAPGSNLAEYVRSATIEATKPR